jgi:SAM-dependent methyltransferase
MPPAPALPPEQIAALRPARGFAEETHFHLNVLGGWIFVPDQELTAAQVYLEGEPVGFIQLAERPDVAEFYFKFPHALRSGFELRLAPGRLRTDAVNRVTAVGYRGERPVARLRSLVFADALVPAVPAPPPELIELTQGDHHAPTYRKLGYRYYLQFRDVIARHRAAPDVRQVLDWGCGSGRVAANFLAEPGGPAVCGCDVNEGAVAWCRTSLPGGEFHVTTRKPPLPVADGRFDVVIALGVVGGCGPHEFAEWLPELRRVLAPGGLILMSLQGAFAAAVRFPPEALAQLARAGILDGSAYDACHPPSPQETLYREGFYLTREYVARTWSEYFRILEHGEGEINSDQDLVVMQRPC